MKDIKDLIGKVWNVDCLEFMKEIPDKSIDMILCDLPYGTTACKWDTIILFEPLWKQYERITKDNSAIILFCQQPFTSFLISFNFNLFKYMWYWKKSRPSGLVNSKLKPLKDIEEIAIFSKGMTANGSRNNMIYNPQNLIDCNYIYKRPKSNVTYNGVSSIRKNTHKKRIVLKKNYPRQILDFNSVHNKDLLHPTQKPVALFEYLIKTYTNENDIVLDNCMGSGTTAIACIHTGRQFIGCDNSEKYCKIATKRIEKEKDQLKLKI